MKKRAIWSLLLSSTSIMTAAAMAETGSATAEVSATPPALIIEEVQPYQMQLSRKAGTIISSGFLLSAWPTHLDRNPEDSVRPGCIRIAGDTSKTLEIIVSAYTPLVAPGGADITFNGTPKFSVKTSGVDCSDAIAASGTVVSPNGTPVTATTSASGQIFLAWQYDRPTYNTGGMKINSWEEGIYSGTVDFEINYQ